MDNTAEGWRNKKYRKIGLPSKEPRNGYNLILSIDSDIQKIVQLSCVRL